MPFVLTDGQGTLHKVDKEGVETRPDYRGDLNLAGKQWKIAGWVKVSKNGDKWLSLKVEEPRQKPALETPPPAPPRQREINPDDDIPFIVNECVFDVGTKHARRIARHGRKTLLQVWTD